MSKPSDLGKCSSTLEGNELESAPESGQHKLQFPEGATVGSFFFFTSLALRKSVLR